MVLRIRSSKRLQCSLAGLGLTSARVLRSCLSPLGRGGEARLHHRPLVVEGRVKSPFVCGAAAQFGSRSAQILTTRFVPASWVARRPCGLPWPHGLRRSCCAWVAAAPWDVVNRPTARPTARPTVPDRPATCRGLDMYADLGGPATGPAPPGVPAGMSAVKPRDLFEGRVGGTAGGAKALVSSARAARVSARGARACVAATLRVGFACWSAVADLHVFVQTRPSREGRQGVVKRARQGSTVLARPLLTALFIAPPVTDDFGDFGPDRPVGRRRDPWALRFSDSTHQMVQL